ncbi:hypothetical protein SDC9_153392 [bioreactor metagenome]|uniref:Uncharacterized protein n=1 Tax=bioreactor metagenome TaxID=1076179 RepID=A0A645EW85_9ZZZZ|nr:hypothetical protein [Rikenellaceae bacterium]
MKEKINIDQPKLKENPFSVPDRYFEKLEANISERISQTAPKPRWWSVLKPQLALASTFGIILLMGYGAVTLLTPDTKKTEPIPDNQISEFSQTINTETGEFDENTDSLSQTKGIDPDQIVEYLNADASLVYLASLE